MNSDSVIGFPPEPTVGTLRVIGGRRLEERTPYTAVLTPPSRAARGREGDRLFLLMDLTGAVSPHLCRELREVMAQAYWSTAGSITAALRQAAAAANRHLFHINLHAPPSDRCQGHLICAVQHGDDLFILQVGSARACFLHGRYLQCFSRDEPPPPAGTGRMAGGHLYHTFIAPGDVLLLASPAFMRESDNAGLIRVLSRGEMQEAIEGLEQVGAGTDFSALLVRWSPPGQEPAADKAPSPSPQTKRRRLWPRPRRRAAAPRAETPAAREVPSPVPTPKTPVSSEASARPAIASPGQAGLDQFDQAARPRERARPKPRARPRPAGPSLGARLAGIGRLVGGGIVAAGAGLVGAMGTLLRRTLPGPEREARRRARAPRTRRPRPIPKENRTLMMVIAIGIPIVLAIVVALAYLSFGTDARFRSLIRQAEAEAALAQEAGGLGEETRPHWEAVLNYANQAIELQPGDPVATALQVQAQAALDYLDGIVRLEPVLLWDFRPGTVPRRMVVHGQTIFVLDPAGGWVAQLTLNPTGDGVTEQGDPTLVRTGQQVGEGRVGQLVDLTWVDPGGERQTSALLILEEGGALVSYDPAWVDEGGAPQLMRSLLGTPPAGKPKAVSSFGGRFYILDPTANQIWRYEPRGNVYPEQPDRYFVTPPPRPLEDVLDMAIDGNVYLLHQGGTIIKFLRSEPQPFEVSGLPGDLSQAIALAVDQDGNSGVVYVADRGGGEQGGGRVVALGPDGAFQAQFRAGGAFDALEALAVDEAAGRLYVISGGRLYVAPLP